MESHVRTINPLTRCLQFLLLGSGPSKVGFVADLVVNDGDGCDLVSMVLLGIFIGLLAYRWKIYW